MNYLIALLAFSAVMIVLATLTTVLVESIHKLLRTRSHDFDEMLRQLYKKAVRPQLKNAGVYLSTETEKFVRQMRENPAIGRSKHSLFNKLFVRTEFETLTTRQFVEQFAQTEAGQKLLLKIENKEAHVVADTISNLSYEFERYGQAASEYFRRRAGFFSLLVAFMLATTLNIDAIRLYGTLAKDPSLANQVIQQLDIEKLNNAEVNALARATSETDKQAIIESYTYMKENYRSVSEQLNDVSLPIGHNFYPYCADSTMDARCKSIKKHSEEEHNITIWSPIDPFLSWCKHLFIGAIAVITSEDGWVWLFRIILTTGMIGLGAPFWYKAYRFVGQFIPGRQHSVADSIEKRRQTSTPVPPPQSQPVQISVFEAGTTTSTNQVSYKQHSTTPKTRGLASADDTVIPVVQTVQSMPSTFQVQGQTGLLKDDLFNILKNTSVDKTEE